MMMTGEDSENKTREAGEERRRNDRRQTHIDPANLPFPDRRKGGDRRQRDRVVISEEESEEILKRISPPNSDAPTPDS